MKRKAMVLVAHADDETLGAGGLIQKLVKADWEVSVVFITNGILDVRGLIEDNREDAKNACMLLGVTNCYFLDYKDQYFDTYAIADMANSVAQLGLDPDLIITHAETDLNLDHRITADIARIIGRPKKKPIAILACEVPSTSFWNAHPFPANYFVDITNEIDTKIEAFSLYKNELQEYPHPWSKKGLKLLAEYHGMQAGYQYAEAYQLVRGYENLLL